jgi:hypothetical protein
MGLALVMTLSIVVPASSEAAGLSSGLRDGNVLELVLHWFSDLWGGDRTGIATTRTASTDPGTGTTTSGTATPCGGDQGVCIDPNGTPK